MHLLVHKFNLCTCRCINLAFCYKSIYNKKKQVPGGNQMVFIAIIGDLKKSKKIEDRKNIQNKLKSVLQKINKEYEKDIAAKFVITLGDEFQGLLYKGENVINIIEEIQREMSPIEIRFGIGVGAITTDIDSEMAMGADGPGYYMARKAIELIKENERKNKTYSSNIRIELEEDRHSTSILLNTIFSLLSVVKKEWTDRQREIISDFEKYQDGQEKSSERLGITQSSVQRGLTNGNYYSYKNAKDVVNNILKEIGGEDV